MKKKRKRTIKKEQNRKSDPLVVELLIEREVQPKSPRLHILNGKISSQCRIASVPIFEVVFRAVGEVCGLEKDFRNR